MALRDNKVSVFSIVDGINVPRYFDPKILRSALRYKARSGDIFIVTYPNSGTTWMETIVFGLLNKGKPFDDDMSYYMAQTPFFERWGEDAVVKMAGPGSIKTHLQFDHIPNHPQAKYICVIRNPKDVCVSMYCYVEEVPAFGFADTKFETFFDAFLTGQIVYGSCFEYIRSLWSHKDDDNVLLVSYEQMKGNLAEVIRQVAQFLEIELKDEMLERIVTHSSFDYMKQRFDKARNAFFAQHVDKDPALGHHLHIVRKGNVGDWSSRMSEEQVQRLDHVLAEMTHSMPGLDTMWSSKPK